MVTIESTPEFARQVYQKMTSNLEVVRSRLGRPMSLAEKVLLSHLDNPQEQELDPGNTYIEVNPDRVILQDVLGPVSYTHLTQPTNREV